MRTNADLTDEELAEGEAAIAAITGAPATRALSRRLARSDDGQFVLELREPLISLRDLQNRAPSCANAPWGFEGRDPGAPPRGEIASYPSVIGEKRVYLPLAEGIARLEGPNPEAEIDRRRELFESAVREVKEADRQRLQGLRDERERAARWKAERPARWAALSKLERALYTAASREPRTVAGGLKLVAALVAGSDHGLVVVADTFESNESA